MVSTESELDDMNDEPTTTGGKAGANKEKEMDTDTDDEEEMQLNKVLVST